MPKQKCVPVDLESLPALTLEEARKLYQGQRLYSRLHTTVAGRPYHLKITSIKTWKKDPGRIEIRVAWGLYTHFHIDQDHLDELSVWASLEDEQEWASFMASLEPQLVQQCSG
jgi:hypothetical protein